MKIRFFTYILTLCSIAFFSCEKEEDRAILNPAGISGFSASATDFVFTEEKEGEAAAAFAWAPADFGFNAATQYTLQFGAEGTDFAEPKSIIVGNVLDTTLTVGALNNLAIQLGLAPEAAGKLQVRLVAETLTPNGVSELVAPQLSTPITLSITPYSTFVEPGYIYVPGAYQGWNPGNAPALISVENDGVYQGLISFVGAEELKFKFTEGQSWDVNYGQGDAAGTLSLNGSDLAVPAADTYLLEANLNDLTWSATKHSWGIIGDATPGGWDGDTNLKYSAEEGVWKTTADLTAGNIKFRLNDDWATNYGDDDTSNDLLNAAGKDIPVSAAGTYEITLDLREEGNPKYSIVKM